MHFEPQVEDFPCFFTITRLSESNKRLISSVIKLGSHWTFYTAYLNTQSYFISVTFDQPPDQSIVDSATYIDCINYFVEMMMDKALDGLRKGGKRPPGAQENVVQAKNTVLVLPKLPQYVLLYITISL